MKNGKEIFEIAKEMHQSIFPISNEDWNLLEAQLTVKEFAKNDFFIKSGQIEKQIGVIVKGSFKWFFTSEKGQNVNFHFFFERDFVVEFHSFITQSPSLMDIQAMEDSLVVMLPPREKILDAYGASHNWAQFGRIVAESVYTQAASRLHEMLFYAAEQRYLNLMHRFPEIFQRVSPSEISSYLGIRGPSLSRIRKKIPGKS